jgi:endonuclease III
MITKELSNKILTALRRYYRDVKTPLHYGNRYELAVAVVLSAQTTDRQVNGVTGPLFAKYPGFKRLARAAPADVRRIIRSTGFYRNKAKNIVGLAQQVVTRFDGRLPDTREELMSLPGIGRKSANVILSMGFGKPALAVDTHVMRVARRLAFTGSRNPLAVENDLIKVIPEKKWTFAHLLFIRHGRETCRARTPLCHGCPVNAYCDSPEKIPTQ